MSKFFLSIIREINPFSETDCGNCPARVQGGEDEERCEVFSKILNETPNNFELNMMGADRLPECVSAEKRVTERLKIRHEPCMTRAGGFTCLRCEESLSAEQVLASNNLEFPSCADQ